MSKKERKTYSLSLDVIGKIKSKAVDHGDKSRYIELLVLTDESKSLEELENKLNEKQNK